jgi:hypothetical protein
MTEQVIEEIENEVAQDMHFHYPPHNNVLRSPNPVLIIDTRTDSHFFMVSGDYVPDDHTDFDHTYFYIVPNPTIDYKTSVGKRLIFLLDLNSDKLDENGNPIKKYRIPQTNHSPDYNEILNKDLYCSLIPYPNKENHNHDYSDFIHDFNMIHPANDNELFHPPD